MSSPTRGKYGRKPAKNTPAIRLADILTGVVPAPPASVDYGNRFTGWQMLGNDTYGDCVAVTWANQRALVTTVLDGATKYPDLTQVETFYKTQNPGFPQQDDGMDIQTALEDLVTNGGPDGVKAVAFAKVDYTNEAELHTAHAIFGQVWYGVNVLDANQTEFADGQPWDYVAGSPVDGGHSVTGVGYLPADYKFVTWAAETEWTEAFRTHQVEEAWVVIWPEHLGTAEFDAGIDQAALAAAYTQVTGKTIPNFPPPAPVPTPSPTPTPAPPVPAPPAPTPVPAPPQYPPDAADLSFAPILRAFVAKHHIGANEVEAKAGAVWLAAKGLT